MGRILIIKNVDFSNQAVDNVTPRPIGEIDITGNIERTDIHYQFLHNPNSVKFKDALQCTNSLSNYAAVLDITEYVGSTMLITWCTENKNTEESDLIYYKRWFASSIQTPITEVEMSSGELLTDFAPAVQYINGTKISGEEDSYITESFVIPDDAKYLVFTEKMNYPTTVKVVM